MPRSTSLWPVLAVAACGQGGAPPVAAPTVSSASSAVPAASDAADAGCPDEPSYAAQPAWSGRPSGVPDPPALPLTPIKVVDAYTVYGAVHQLRSLLHDQEVRSAPIAIRGYVVDSNIPRAPRCAIHPSTRSDPPDCLPELPTFWLADDKAGTTGPRIRVVGWARSFAVVRDAMTAYGAAKPGAPSKIVRDDILDVSVPNPLPAVGMKVRVTGMYDTVKYVVSEAVREPTGGGVMALHTMDVLEPAAAPAAFGKPAH